MSHMPPLTPSLEEGLTQVTDFMGRQDWEAARELAHRLVATHPTSPSAHAVLGDIAGATHHYREAVEWYELAVRLEPNAAVQSRLDRARQALGREREGGSSEALPAVRNSRLPVYIAIAAGFVALCLLVAFLTMSALRTRERRAGGEASRRVRPAERPGLPGTVTPPSSQRPRPDSRPLAGGVTSSGSARGYAVPGASPARSGGQVPPQQITQSVTGPLSDSDLLLTRSLGTVTWPSGAPIGVDVQAALDPFTGYTFITLQIPSSLPRAEAYPIAIDTAYRLAVTAVRTDRTVESITVRVLVSLTTEDGKKTVLVAFRGNTNRETLDYYLKRNLQPDRETLWRNVFAATWWNPSVPSS